jgi:ABC-type phosphate transport system substrate-binding protein
MLFERLSDNGTDRLVFYPCRFIFISLLLAGLTVFSAKLLAQYQPDPRGLVIVMNVNTDIQSMDAVQIRNLFTGKSRRMPNGKRAALASFAPEASFFNARMLQMSDAEVQAAWSRLRFSGRAPPPRTFDTAKQVVEYVARTPNALAYLPASVARQNVSVIYNLPR